MKIEEGPTQTLARKIGGHWVLNDPPPDPTLELLKCQRYQWICSSVAWEIFAIAQAVSATLAVALIDFPVTMRTSPNIYSEGSFVLTDLLTVASSKEVTKIEKYMASVNSVRLNVFSAGLTPGKTYFLRTPVSNSKLIFDANL